MGGSGRPSSAAAPCARPVVRQPYIANQTRLTSGFEMCFGIGSPSTFGCWGQNMSRIQYIPKVTLAPCRAYFVSSGCSSWSSSRGIASAARDTSFCMLDNRDPCVCCFKACMPLFPVFVTYCPYLPQLHDSIHMLHGCAMIAKQVLLLGCVGDRRWRSGGHRCLLFSFDIQQVHYVPKVRNRACDQSRLGLPEARRRRRGAAAARLYLDSYAH